MAQARDATLVLDIGKTRAKLLLLDPDGDVRWNTACDNAPQAVPAGAAGEPGYLALGIARLHGWLDDTLATLGRELQGAAARDRPRRLITTTHGASFVALGEHGALRPPLDYEWDGYGTDTADFDASLADFTHHGTPRLPLGLNAGRQIDWQLRHYAQVLERLRCWLPYPQYWAWWLSGVAASEVSSLGCHTGLWSPAQSRFSDWAQARGVAAHFAPVRRAWEVLGPLRSELAARWQLPTDLQVLVGAHDSNACLARHLRTHPDAVVVSSGTWTVAMAPGAGLDRLQPHRDELVNVAVDGRPVPTARFMGGREFDALCGGTDPTLATAEALGELLAAGWWALPCWSDGGGPFAGHEGQVMRGSEIVEGGIGRVPAQLRPALAALYVARMCASLIDRLRPQAATVILEGPFAHNEALCAVLSQELAGKPLLCSADRVEGTARGAWCLAHACDESAARALVQPTQFTAPHALRNEALASDRRRWRAVCAALH